MTIVDTLTVRIAADTSELERALDATGAATAVLGRAFDAAFAGAIGRGKALQDILRRLQQDLLRLALDQVLGARRSPSRGIDLGGILSSALGGLLGRASGGPVSKGAPYMVGERGPELFVPDMAGAVMPSHALGSGGNVSIAYSIDARGADAGVEARLRAALRESEARTLAAVRALADRGGAFARSVGRR